jgi:hypothetical protein
MAARLACLRNRQLGFADGQAAIGIPSPIDEALAVCVLPGNSPTEAA